MVQRSLKYLGIFFKAFEIKMFYLVYSLILPGSLSLSCYLLQIHRSGKFLYLLNLFFIKWNTSNLIIFTYKFNKHIDSTGCVCPITVSTNLISIHLTDRSSTNGHLNMSFAFLLKTINNRFHVSHCCC